MQEMHIISAGSLLEFTLESENFKMPVGRIQYLYMYPTSFGEFLEALNEKIVREFITDVNNLKNIPEFIHHKLIELTRKYFILGGMPAVIKEYIQSEDVIKCQRVQRLIIDTYYDDFSKYARHSEHKYLQKVFFAVPLLIGKKFVYAAVDNSIKTRDLKSAFELMEMAGVIRKVRKTSGSGIPFELGSKDTYFKSIFLDVGLMHSMHDIFPEMLMAKDLSAVFRGAVAEQFVGQELLANSSPFSRPRLFYWNRDARGSMAEIDYLVPTKSNPLPIEVKSGIIGHLKNLNMYMNTYGIEKGVKISQTPYNDHNRIISYPFYSLENLLSHLLNHNNQEFNH